MGKTRIYWANAGLPGGQNWRSSGETLGFSTVRQSVPGGKNTDLPEQNTGLPGGHNWRSNGETRDFYHCRSVHPVGKTRICPTSRNLVNSVGKAGHGFTHGLRISQSDIQKKGNVEEMNHPDTHCRLMLVDETVEKYEFCTAQSNIQLSHKQGRPEFSDLSQNYVVRALTVR